jgi:hypothetical protein
MLTGIGGVETESIIVRLRTASSFMDRLAMQTRFHLEHQLRELRDLQSGRCHTVGRAFMIVLLLEVSCGRIGQNVAYNCGVRCCFYL